MICVSRPTYPPLWRAVICTGTLVGAGAFVGVVDENGIW